jgi:hypothetical protein
VRREPELGESGREREVSAAHETRRRRRDLSRIVIGDEVERRAELAARRELEAAAVHRPVAGLLVNEPAQERFAEDHERHGEPRIALDRPRQTLAPHDLGLVEAGAEIDERSVA